MDEIKMLLKAKNRHADDHMGEVGGRENKGWSLCRFLVEWFE